MKATNKKPSTYNRKEHIIDVAKKLFYENGYDHTSTRELADAAELSVAGVYYFFQDKEDILFTILHQSIIDLNDALRSAISETDSPEVNLRTLYVRMCHHAITHSAEIMLLNREGGRLSPQQREIIYEHRKESYRILKDLIEQIKDSGKLRSGNTTAIAFSIFASTSWISRWFNPNGDMSLDEMAENMADNFFFGIMN